MPETAPVKERQKNPTIGIACLVFFHYNKEPFLKLISISFMKGGMKMAEEGVVYVCALCGQEVKVLKSGVGTLVCCDQPMDPKED
jgi:desulfoferrodoxin-like iron-binding protein